MRLRDQADVVARCHELADDLRRALARLPHDERDQDVVDAVWAGEALGVLLWSLGLTVLPPYDEPFLSPSLLAVRPEDGRLCDPAAIVRARDTARLWHWRARTTLLEEAGVDPPARFGSFPELVTATAQRGHEEGLLPMPLAGDFPALGRMYRDLDPDEQLELISIAAERQRALEWLLMLGEWNEVPLDT